MERRERLGMFRERLGEVIARSNLSHAAFARSIGVDRSTLSQLMADAGDRLPRSDTVATIAAVHKVSADWLLGLTAEDAAGADILQHALEIASGAPVPADERLARWYAEATAYRIRYVPSTLPDLLKSERVIRYEYGQHATIGPEQALEAAQARLAYLRRPETDMDMCCPVQAIEGFARGEGIWRSLEAAARREQLERMAALARELYPSFRWYLYDALHRFSVPFTIFGPKRAAVYVGQMYFVFNSTEHIRVLTRHFDDLIRAAQVTPPEVPGFLERLIGELDGGAAGSGAKRARKGS